MTTFRVTHAGDTLVAAGELDMATAPEFSASLAEACRTATGDVRVDLSALTFMDSSGARCFISALRHLAPGRSLELVGQAGMVDRTIRLLGLDGLDGIRCGPATPTAPAAA